MPGKWRHSGIRTATSPGAALVALIVVLGAGGYLLTSTTIRHDQDAAAARRAEVEAVHTQEVLGRARAYVAGLSDVLAGEPQPGQAQFARWARGTAASVGLNDVLWVQRVPASARERYEQRRGVAITRLTPAGTFVPAPVAASLLPATFTSRSRPELRPGVDVTAFPGLGQAIGDRARIFAVGASTPGSIGGEPGFFLLEAATFARGPDSRGYLVAFVPRGWFSTSLGGDPRRIAISQDGHPIEGKLDSVQASAQFELLGREWRIDVAREPPSGLQSMLPWLALAWPVAIAGIVFAIARAISLRRRAQRDVERIFELSLDPMGIVGSDGRFKAVNPAWEQTLGHSRQQMVGRPYAEIVHPDDLDASRETFAVVLAGEGVNQFENRCISADGSVRWLQWSARGVPEQGVIHATGRDVTELRIRSLEQAALRRVATLVAREASQAEVFSAIAVEARRLLGVEHVQIMRYEAGESAVVVASAGEALPAGSRHRLGGENLISLVFRGGGPARIDDYERASGAIADAVRSTGVRSAVATPIHVKDRLWGVLAASTTQDDPLPRRPRRGSPSSPSCVATAIANAEARGEVAAAGRGAGGAAAGRDAGRARAPRRARSWTRWWRRWTRCWTPGRSR